MDPAEMTTLFGYARNQANAYLFAPNDPAICPTGAVHKTIDYLLCSHSVHPWIQTVEVDYGVKASPHRAVRVRLQAERTNYLVESLASPKQFPRSKPTGCARAPVLPQWTSDPERGAGFSCPGVHPSGHTGCNALASEMWPALAHAIESELCRVTDQVNQRGMASSTCSGRARGVRTVQFQAMPKRTSASMGKVDVISHALRCFAVRVNELANVFAKIYDGRPISINTVAQCNAILANLLATNGLVQVVRNISNDWDMMVSSVCSHTPGLDTQLLWRIVACAEEDAIGHKRTHAEARAESWRAHVASQLKNGAAATHRWVKRDSTPQSPLDTVGAGATRSASPQVIVDQDLGTWKEIWNRPVPAIAPWRQCAQLDPLPKITGREVRRAAGRREAQGRTG